MDANAENQIIAEMQTYCADEFELYCAEAGWQDWMNEHTTALEDQECSEREIQNINNIQIELWMEAHNRKGK